MDTFGLSDVTEETEFHSRVAHLTNLSVQKKHPEYQARKEEIAMTMEMLRDYFVGQGQATIEDFKTRVTDKINEVMRLVFLQSKDKLDRRFGCFETFGFDFMLDQDLSPILLEINVNPALHLDTSSQAKIIPKLIQDIVKMADAIHEPNMVEST